MQTFETALVDSKTTVTIIYTVKKKKKLFIFSKAASFYMCTFAIHLYGELLVQL